MAVIFFIQHWLDMSFFSFLFVCFGRFSASWKCFGMYVYWSHFDFSGNCWPDYSGMMKKVCINQTLFFISYVLAVMQSTPIYWLIGWHWMLFIHLSCCWLLYNLSFWFIMNIKGWHFFLWKKKRLNKVISLIIIS